MQLIPCFPKDRYQIQNSIELHVQKMERPRPR